MSMNATSDLNSAAPDAAASATSAANVDATPTEPALDVVKLEAPETPAVAASEIPPVPPSVEAAKPETPRPSSSEISIFAPERQSQKSAPASPARQKRWGMLAAAIALAASFGALAGVVGTSGLGRPAVASPDASVPQDIHALHTTIDQMRSELTALRSGVESGTRSTNTQFGKITERFDRVERAQAERAAKFAKATEAIERLDRRAEAAPAKETTGSIATPPAAPTHPPAAAPSAATAHPPAAVPTPTPAPAPQQQASLPGWSIRDVYRGVAVIQSGRTGMMEVEAGDVVPYLGRIESIRRHEGRWVVVTSRGPIISGR
jgi:hypothetical protein